MYNHVPEYCICVQRCNVGSKKRHIEGLHVYLHDPEFLVQHECYIILLYYLLLLGI